MQLSLDNDTMKNLVSEAIFQSFDAQKREELVKVALQTLLQPPPENYSSRTKPKSPLQEAFESAIVDHARILVRESLTNRPEIKEELDKIILEGMNKFLTDKREDMVEKIADAMRKGITGERF